MNKISVIGLTGLLIAYSCGVSYAAEWANPQLLVTPDIVEENIDKPDWVVVDCRPLNEYIAGHIPGAISFGGQCARALRDGTERAFRDISKYEKILGKVGISNDSNIVFYHGNQWTLLDATVGFWLLEYLGHDKVYVLDGGIDAWRKAGKRLSNKPTRKKSTVFKANPVSARYATSAEMLQVGKGDLSGIQVIDSRTKSEYDGSEVHSLRGGHIPNTTINVSHEKTLATGKNRKTGKMEVIEYFDVDNVAEKFAGLDKNKRTVAYCHTGTRASMTYLQLRLLGFKDPANYDESWRVYGSNIDFPVENEQWFDFWNAQWRADDLERRVKELEKSIANKN
jgi:thiosulfate/3-mercaptopyruvate sulfurtransferase